MKYRAGERMSQTQDVRNNGVLKSWLKQWTWAAFNNHAKIFDEIVGEEKPWQLEKFEGSHKGEPAIIIGAGTSVDKLWPIISDWKGAIFAPESLAQTCVYHGHKPDYLMVFDAHEKVWQNWLKDFDWSGTTLITHPAASIEMIDKWTEDKIYYLMLHISRLHEELKGKNLLEKEIHAKDQLIGFDFFENVQPVAYNFIRAKILNAGCVVNNSIQVAHFMGYGPIFLAGVDFGFKDWNNRTDKWMLENDKWVCTEGGVIGHEEDGKMVGTDIGREIIMSLNDIPTTEEQIEYKTALMSVYKLDRPQLIDCSDGIITELPKEDITEVVKKNGKGFERSYRVNEEIIGIADEYLHRRKDIHPK